MSEELAIEILKQATIETTTGACETCPRKDKNKTCIGCLDEAKENILNQLQQKENIIKEVREYIKKYRTMVDGYEDEETGQMIYEHRLKLNKHQVRKLLEILDKENK